MSELEQLIKKVVHEEFKVVGKKYIQAYVPLIIKEVVDDLVDKRLNEIARASANRKPTLTEQFETAMDGEDWSNSAPKKLTPQNRSKLASLMGYGESVETSPKPRGRPNLIEHMITESGTPVPVDPRAIPESVLNAMNRDYRKFLKVVEEHKGAGASVPLGTPIGGDY